MLDPPRIAPALDQIDPQSRALIELFYRRGLAEADIEDLLGLGDGGLTSRRTAAEIELAGELGVGLGELQAGLPDLSVEAWTGQVPPEEPADEKEDSSGLAPWIGLLVAGIATAVIVVIVVAANADGGDDSKSGKPAPAEQARETTTSPRNGTPAPPATPVVELQRLNGTNGKGTAQVTGEAGRKRVRLKVRDFLQPQGGGYAVWLYNSPTDAKLLQSTQQSTFDVSLPLAADYKRYSFVDVSREADSNPGHMGLSLLRAPFTELEAK